MLHLTFERLFFEDNTPVIPGFMVIPCIILCHSIHLSLVIPGLTGNLVGVDARSGPGMTEKQTGHD